MAVMNLLQDNMNDADGTFVELAPVTKKPASNSAVIDTLTKQILAQGLSDKWQGGVSPSVAAKDMARIMAGIGITDIKQFGIIEKPYDAEVRPDNQGGYVDLQGNSIDPSLVTANNYAGESGEWTTYTAPIEKVQTFGNKVTGQEVPTTYSERQTGNAWGGTFEGKGNTGYRVDFKPDGTPIFYTTGASSSDVASWMPLLQLGLAITGAGGLLGNALLGSTAGQVASNVLGNALLGGTTTSIAGGDFFKGALKAGIAAGLVPATEMVLGKIPDFNTLSNPIKAAVSSAVSGTIMNKGEITPAVLVSALAAGLGAAGKDAELRKFESQMTESGLAGQTSITDEDMRKLGIVSDTNLPSGTQVAGPMTLSVGGVPIYAESSGASAIRPPAGYEVMSSSLADNKPAGSYYDASINAWLQPTNEFAKVTDLDKILADIELFKGSVNTIDPNVIKNIVDSSLSELPAGITLDDVTRVLSSQNYARPEDIQAAINSINIPKGITNQDVQSIVSTALTNNPSLTTDQISQIVNNAVTNIPKGLTAEDVTKIIGGQNFATPQDIQTAISNIKIPQGLSSTDVQSIVSNALANNPSLTTTDVQAIVNDAVSKIPAGLSASDVTNILSKQNFATPQDIQTAINSINIPQGLSEQDVKTIVSNAFASNPSLTSTQVSQIVNSAISQIPSGLTAGDVQSIVGTAVSKLPAAPTTQDIINIIGGQGLASTSQLTQQGQDLMAALRAQGVDYNTALNQAIQSQSTGFNASINDVIKQIGGVQTGLESQIGNVQSGLESQLSAQGKQLMASLQQQGVDYQTALNQALATQGNQFTNQITNVRADLESQLSSQNKDLMTYLQQQGIDYDTALNEALAAQQSQLQEVQTGLETKIGDVKNTFEEQLAKSNEFNADSFAKLMQTLGLVGTTISAMEAASKPKTYTYNLADPSTWGSPVYNQTANPVTPMTPLDFGNREMLRGTQWEKFLSPTYGQVPAPVQFNQPSNIRYDQLMNILGAGRDVLPSQALSINDVISGIQNQYGQIPTGSMGQKPT